MWLTAEAFRELVGVRHGSSLDFIHGLPVEIEKSEA